MGSDIIEVTEFSEGKSLFQSNGISEVKITKDGEVKCLRIPITSTGIADIIDTFHEQSPKPPMVKELVLPGSDMYKELKMTRKNYIKIPDYGDANYIKAKEEHDSDLAMAILLKGIAVPIKDKDGKAVTDRTKKIKILKDMEMSGDQFAQIVGDIRSLTNWDSEEKESFFV